VSGYKGLVASLKNCMSDDWAPDLRYACVCLCQKLLGCMDGQLSYEEMLDFYPTLLERLDDAQDPVRIEVCKAIKVFLETNRYTISDSTWTYIVKACLVHLDDTNEEVQLAVFSLLKAAADINSKALLGEVIFLDYRRNNFPIGPGRVAETKVPKIVQGVGQVHRGQKLINLWPAAAGVISKYFVVM
jgi:hypothetical protein